MWKRRGKEFLRPEFFPPSFWDRLPASHVQSGPLIVPALCLGNCLVFSQTFCFLLCHLLRLVYLRSTQEEKDTKIIFCGLNWNSLSDANVLWHFNNTSYYPYPDSALLALVTVKGKLIFFLFMMVGSDREATLWLSYLYYFGGGRIYWWFCWYSFIRIFTNNQKTPTLNNFKVKATTFIGYNCQLCPVL